MRLRPPPPLLPWRGNYARIFALPKSGHPKLAYLTWDVGIALGIHHDRDREALCVDGRDSEADERVIRALAQELFGSDDALKYHLA